MKLPDGSGSWVVTCLVSGRVWEIFEKSDHDKIVEADLQSVKVETARKYLERISEDVCRCVYATAKNTPSVRKGYGMGGYLKSECAACAKKAKGEIE